MKKYLLLIGLAFLISGSASAQFGRQWVKTYSDPSLQGNTPTALTLNSAGCVIVTGTAYDSTKKINQIQTIKYDPSGNALWQVKYVSSFTCDPTDITTDASGNIFISVNLVDTAEKIHVLKYNCSGKLVWDAVYPNSVLNTLNLSYRIAVDGGGNIFVGATSECTLCYNNFRNFQEANIIKFDSNGHYVTEMRTGRIFTIDRFYNTTDALNDMVIVSNKTIYSITNLAQDSIPETSHGSTPNSTAIDFGLEKHDTSGRREFLKRISRPTKQDFPVSLFVGKNEDIFITGWTADTAANAKKSYLTAKLDSAGNILYMKERGNAAWNSEGISIVADDFGNAYIVGQPFKNGVVSNIELIKYDPKGNEIWAKIYSNTFNNYLAGSPIRIDAQANIYINANSTDGNNSDCLVLKYDSSGSLIGEYRTNGPSNQNDYSSGMVVNAAGEIFITGNSQSVNGTDYLTAKYGFPTTAIGDSLCSKVGVSELKSADNTFSIYPDPANQSVAISWQQAEGKNVELKIVDITGKEVLHSNAAGPEFKVDIRSLANGIYVVTLTAEGRTKSENISVQR